MALLPNNDEAYLNERDFDYQLKQVGSEIQLFIRDWPFPPAYTPRSAELLIKIPPGYPFNQLDMFWTIPDIKLVNGSWPQASEVHEPCDGRSWQRWSRHTQEWRPGIDDLRTFIAAITSEINRGI